SVQRPHPPGPLSPGASSPRWCMMSPMAKGKIIKSTLKDLVKALEHHADAVSGSAVSVKKAQRAAAKVVAAANAYADAVETKTGLGNPFTTGGGALGDETIASLAAERDEIERAVNGNGAAESASE